MIVDVSVIANVIENVVAEGDDIVPEGPEGSKMPPAREAAQHRRLR